MLSKLAKPCGSGTPVAKKQASNIRILADWGDAPAGIIHYLLCSKCGNLPSTTFRLPDIFLCAERHVTCVLCGLSALSCPYIRLRNGHCCRKLMSRMTMCIAQQRLTVYLASVLKSDSDSDSDSDEDDETSPKVGKVPSNVVEEEKKEAPFSKEFLAQAAAFAEEVEVVEIPEKFEVAEIPGEVEVTEKSEEDEVTVNPREVEVTEKSIEAGIAEIPEKSEEVEVAENSEEVEVAEIPGKVEVAEKPDQVVITIEDSPGRGKISLKQHMHNFTKQKAAEFSHLPLAEKIVAVKAAIEAELASHKKHK